VHTTSSTGGYDLLMLSETSCLSEQRQCNAPATLNHRLLGE
jgi:hypothetical protein